MGMCKECGNGLETIKHVFFQCHKAQFIWKLFSVSWDGLFHATDCFRLVQGKADKGQELQHIYEITNYVMWSMWKARNANCFGAERWTKIDIINRACKVWLEYKNAQPTEEVQSSRRCMIAIPNR